MSSQKFAENCKLLQDYFLLLDMMKIQNLELSEVDLNIMIKQTINMELNNSQKKMINNIMDFTIN